MVRRIAGLMALAVVAVGAAGCSGGGGGTGKPAGSKGPTACELVSRLDDLAATVGRANVSDPAAFRATLDTAVQQYADTLAALRAKVPANLAADLERVEADVKQYRFQDALADRASLDAYAQSACGRTIGSTTPFGSPSTTAASATTVLGAP